MRLRDAPAYEGRQSALAVASRRLPIVELICCSRSRMTAEVPTTISEGRTTPVAVRADSSPVSAGRFDERTSRSATKATTCSAHGSASCGKMALTTSAPRPASARSPDSRRRRRLNDWDERFEPYAMISLTALASGEGPARWTSTSSPFRGTRQNAMELAPTVRRHSSINRARCRRVPTHNASICRMARTTSPGQRSLEGFTASIDTTAGGRSA